MRLALVIGNSRLHWGVLSEAAIHSIWNTGHLNEKAIATLRDSPNLLPSLLTLASQRELEHAPITLPVVVVSVVPRQTALWKQQIPCQIITLEQVPLHGLYTTMGIDRAIAALGAGESYGFPTLVIDGGTALTLTGVDGDRRVIGGAILPGLSLQGRSLTQHTAALPNIDVLPQSSSPLSAIPRWATTTTEAIRSGIFHTVLSGLRDFSEDWYQTYVNSRIVITGGDGAFLHHHLGGRYPHLKPRILFDPNLVFKGIQAMIKKTPRALNDPEHDDL